MKIETPNTAIKSQTGQWTIAKKIGAMVALMVAIQVCLQGVWWYVQLHDDAQAFQDGDAREVSAAVEGSVFRTTALIEHINAMLATGQPLSDSTAGDARQVHVWVRHLETLLLADHDPQSDRLEQIEKTADDLLASARTYAADQNKHSDALVAERQSIRQTELRLEDMLWKLADHSVYHTADTGRLDPQRKNLLLSVVFVGTVINSLLLLLLGRYFLRDVVGRLSIMVDNTLRLGTDSRLHPPLPGTDEIAQLDGAMHDMSASLKEALERQQSLMHNARELICSLDQQLKFLTVSDAAKSVLGYHPEGLIGKPLSTVVLPAERSKLSAGLRSAESDNTHIELEAKVFRADDTTAETEWSINFSRKDGVLYCVVRDISERKAVERLRKEVVQMISHDLRSPLAAIHVCHTLLLSGTIAQLNEQGTKLAHNADASGARMLELVNDLLDSEKLQSGTLILELQPVKVSEMSEQAIQSVQLLADNKHLRLLAQHDEFVVLADRRRIVQVLVNLLSNAIKFSGENTYVRIEADRHENQIEIRVIDQGSGIPAESLNTVFDRFQQLDSAAAVRKSGSGLGLAICKELVELHGGTIGVTSSPGQGATFYFRLPQVETVIVETNRQPPASP